MFVNRYNLKISDISKLSGGSINIPVYGDDFITGQEDIINDKFVNVEYEKSINPIIDYEKVRFIYKDLTINSTPKYGYNDIIYVINLLKNNTLSGVTLSDIGFEYDDIRFRKYNFMKSFLRLEFYDTDIVSSQNLVYYINLFPIIDNTYYNNDGELKQPENIPLQFIRGHSLKFNNMNSDGYYLYYYKTEVLPTIGKDLFMKAMFFNAKDGKIYRLMSSNDINLSVDELNKSTFGSNIKNNLHTRYRLRREADGFYYDIDKDYSNNVNVLNGVTIITLNELTVV